MTLFLELNSDGKIMIIKNINQSDMLKCNFSIMSPDHYREDGSCKCDDEDHRNFMINEWGYEQKDFENISLKQK